MAATAAFAPSKVDPPPVSRIPADIRARLSDQQIALLEAKLTPPPARSHRLAWRASSRIFGRHFYVAILSGREGRSLRRVTSDGQRVSIVSLLLRIIFVAAWITVTTLVLSIAGIVTIYLAKSILGIDLMDGPSFLHHYFF